jgi:uncharacterized repeat protein (TIGR01451 family)
MKRILTHQLTIWSLAGSLWLTAAGCALPPAGDQPGFRTPANAPTAAATMARVPSPDVSAAMQQTSGQFAGPSVYPEPNAPLAQVGHFVPARLGDACGCLSCGGGNQDCEASCRPHGYAMCTPQGWNAYGIDAQEFLCDGGDKSPPAVVLQNDSVAGLGLEDTVVHYTTTSGDIHVQPSNRACLYAPRFVAVRKITGAVAGGRAIGLRGMDRPVGPVRVEHDLHGLVVTESTELAHAEVSRRTDAMRERNRGVPVEGVLQPEQAAEVLAAVATLKLYDLGELRDNEIALLQELALAAVTWTVDESLEVAIADLKPPTLIRDQRVEGLTIYDFPDTGRLQIVKLADRSDALPGELVTFAIRIDNVGDSAVDHVVLVDNLTTRLEYVPDSQTCEGAKAEFRSEQNEGQSSKLEWTLTEELKVGESVTIRFQCKVL